MSFWIPESRFIRFEIALKQPVIILGVRVLYETSIIFAMAIGLYLFATKCVWRLMAFATFIKKNCINVFAVVDSRNKGTNPIWMHWHFTKAVFSPSLMSFEISDALRIYLGIEDTDGGHIHMQMIHIWRQSYTKSWT